MSDPRCYNGGMNKKYTAIAFVLDRSGSMQGYREAAMDGFNLFLHEQQQQAEGLVKLTLVLFDDEYLVPINALPVAEIVPLNEETYVPRGRTRTLGRNRPYHQRGREASGGDGGKESPPPGGRRRPD